MHCLQLIACLSNLMTLGFMIHIIHGSKFYTRKREAKNKRMNAYQTIYKTHVLLSSSIFGKIKLVKMSNNLPKTRRIAASLWVQRTDHQTAREHFWYSWQQNDHSLLSVQECRYLTLLGEIMSIFPLKQILRWEYNLWLLPKYWKTFL